MSLTGFPPPALMGLSLPGAGEWAVILILILVLFGGKNIPDLAKALGKGIREFKRAVNMTGDDAAPVRDETPGPRDERTAPRVSEQRPQAPGE